MVIGTTLMRLANGIYYSPTFGRGGLGAVFSCEVLDLSSGVSAFDITVEHKNPEDTAFTTLGSFPSFSAVGVETANLTAIKEQVRFMYRITASAASDAVHFNMLSPAWRPY